MKWIKELNKNELLELLNSLKTILKPINPRITISEPIKLHESIKKGQSKDSWVTYIYNIKIESNIGQYETTEGFEGKEDISKEIKDISWRIAFSFWWEKDGKKDSLLGVNLFNAR